MYDIPNNFIHDIIDEAKANGFSQEIHTRFPPEPNGYIHIGSAKAIFINYMTAKKYGGPFNLRYDDTNPVKEKDEFVKSIYNDIVWLVGEAPTGGVFYGSDYFDKCYEFAVKLIKDGKAYVCNLTADEMREYRGTLTQSGKNSPYRDRTPEENLELFEKMKNGEFADGFCTLRAKIDMSSPNMTLRDPAIYRISRAHHHRQGDKWCIYPLYDYAHPIQDALENITHSLCSIEFENNRPLYEWVVDNVEFENKPRQIEFSKLNVTYTVLSKRNLIRLVETGVADGWDDPRMPTLSGLRRRGYTNTSIMKFASLIGISKAYNLVDIELLEYCIRDELNFNAQRKMAVLNPIKVKITNYPEDKTEYFKVSNNPNDEQSGERELAFTNELYIDEADFSNDPPPKYFRLKPGGEVRLAGAYIIKFEELILNSDGSIKEIHCTADLESKNNNPVDGRKVKGTIHWVSSSHCVDATVNMYGRFFTQQNMVTLPEGKDIMDFLNPDSLVVHKNCKLEKSLENTAKGERFQFVRLGYFCKDSMKKDTFNSIISLKDSFKVSL